MNLNSCSNAVHTRYVYAEHCYMNSNSYTACTCFLHIKVVCFRGTKWSPCLHTHPKISQIHHIQLYPIKKDLKLRCFRSEQLFFVLRNLHPWGVVQLTTFWAAPDKPVPKNRRSPRSSCVTWKTLRKQMVIVIRYSSSIFGTWIFWWNGF